MEKDARRSGSPEQAAGLPRAPASHPVPGKVPITSGLSSSRGLAIQRQAAVSTLGPRGPEVRSNWDIAMDPWMDAAHRGVAPLAETARGLKDGSPREGEAVRGIGDTVSDTLDVISTGLGNLTGGVASEETGISISSTTNAGPTFGPQGAAMWHVAFATTGRTGWIVQKIDNKVDGTDASGAAITPASIGLSPHYYEAWSVDASGAVTPSVGGDNDHWDQGSMGASSKGHWSTRGALYWVPGAATPAGMAPRTVPSAGMLVSSFTAPPGLGVARLHRYAHANWDATVTPPVDTGSAS